MKRVFLIVLDSVGVGYLPDAKQYNDDGANTLRSVSKQAEFCMPNMKKLGLFNIDGVDYLKSEKSPLGSFGRMKEISKGKDTTTGHWEIAGIPLKEAFPVFPYGFPLDFIRKFEELVGRKTICNKPYSGTDVIRDYGEEHIKTGSLIVYTSADSVFQIAAHEDVVPISKLYEYCHIARDLLIDDLAVGRVIARPFNGKYPNFKRTAGRHDFSLQPPKDTMLDDIIKNNLSVISVGKISDIFAGRGISKSYATVNNSDGIEKTLMISQEDFEGLCFVNLVDFDMLYGHRNDAKGYALALSEFDRAIPSLIKNLREEDMLIITADHGCDPSDTSTDHTREYVPVVIVGKSVKRGVNLGTRETFSDIAATILEYFGVSGNAYGKSFLKEII